MSIIDDLRIQDDLLVYLYGNINSFGVDASQVAAAFSDKSSEYINRQLLILERKYLIELDQFHVDDPVLVRITDIGCDRAEEILLERHPQESE